MKKIQLIIVVIFMTTALFAQDLITKVPSDASVVGIIKTPKFLKEVSIEEMKTFSFYTQLVDELGVKEIEEVGIDLNRNMYYFVSLTDSASYNCFLVPLKSSSRFEQFIHLDPIVNVDNFRMGGKLGTILMWDKTTLLVATEFGLPTPSYYSDYGYAPEEILETEDEPEPVEYEETIVEDMPQAVDAEEEAVFESTEDEEVVEVDDRVYEETIVEDMPQAVDVEEEAVFESTEDEEIEEEVVDIAYDEPYEESPREVSFATRRAAYHAKQDELLKVFALRILKGNRGRSIAQNVKFMKHQNKKAVATIWSDSYGELYSQLLGGSGGYGMTRKFMDMYKHMNDPGVSGVKGITGQVFLNKDDLTFEISTELAANTLDAYKAMGKRKFNKKFFKYFDGDKSLGYLGFAMNTEGFIDEYPKMIGRLLAIVEPKMGDEISLGIDLLSILLDGKEIGELIKGDAMFVIQDVVEKEKKYTSYEYDEDFNMTKVEKTKMESMPEFLFMLSTDKMPFFEKLLRVGVKKNLATKTSGVFAFKDAGLPVEVYIVLYDGIFFVTSSEYQARDIAAGKTLSVSKKHRKMARKKSVVMFANSAAIINAIPAGLPESAAPSLDYFYTNFPDATVEVHQVKGNVSKTVMKINTTGKKGNALKTFMGLLEEVSHL